MKISTCLILILFAGTTSCVNYKDLPTVEKVELRKYSGLWYEIARLPFFFERDCKCVTAEYGLTEKEYLTVKNTCTKQASGKVKVANGRAWPSDGSDNSKLKVSFFRPFTGDYYIIDLADDYSYAMVGSPDRETLWILARTSTLDAAVLQNLTEKATEMGFPVKDLILTVQDCDVLSP